MTSTYFRDCGGCKGFGRHWRWCKTVVGLNASVRGQQAERAEQLADSVGANNPDAANLLYRASGLLREQALDGAEAFKKQQPPHSDLVTGWV